VSIGANASVVPWLALLVCCCSPGPLLLQSGTIRVGRACHSAYSTRVINGVIDTKSINDIQTVLDSKTDQTAKGVNIFASITSIGTLGIVACIVVCLGSSAISIFLTHGANNVTNNLTKDPAALKDLIKSGAEAVKDVTKNMN
jgi:hypothetical protein